MPLWRPLQWVHNRLWSALSWPVEPMGGGVGVSWMDSGHQWPTLYWYATKWTVVSDVGGFGNRFSIGDDLGHDGLFLNEWRIFILNIVVCVWEFFFLIFIYTSVQVYLQHHKLAVFPFVHKITIISHPVLEKLHRMRLNIETQKCTIEYHEMTHHQNISSCFSLKNT